MMALRAWGGVALGLLAVGLEAGTWPSPRVSLAFALAAMVGWGRWSSLALGLLALVTVILPGSPVGADVQGWSGLLFTGLGLGLLSRSVEPGLVAMFSSERRRVTVTWLSLLSVALVFLPDGHVALFDSSGTLMSYSVVVEDAVSGVRGVQELPAYLLSSHPAEGLVSWLLLFGPLTAFLLLAQGVDSRPGLVRAGWLSARLTGALLAVSGLWGLGQLLGGSIPVPSASELGELLSELAGGSASITAVTTPDGGALSLASRPLVDWMRLAVGALLLVVPSLPAIPAADDGPADHWLSLSLACAVVSCFLLGPAPCAWTIAAVVVCGSVALMHGTTGEGGQRWYDDLQLLTLGLWVAALIAPAAGWVALL